MSHFSRKFAQKLVCSMVTLVSLAFIGMLPARAGILSVGELLRLGDSGPKVASLQQQLQALGLYDGTVTEFFGPQTQAAVLAYQQAQGLRADGVFGTETDSLLFDSLSTQSAPPLAQARTYRLGERVLSLGDRGPDVQELQTLLSTRFSPLATDGIFGSNTQAVVTNFQQQYGLVADGAVGDSTLNTLRNIGVSSTPGGIVSPGGISIQGAGPVQPVLPGTPTFTPANASVSGASSQATFNAAQINDGPYIVVIPSDSDDREKLTWVRRQQPRACMARSRRGSYIFAGGYPEYSNAETVRLTLRADRRPDLNRSRTNARVDYRRGNFTVECLY